MTRREVYDILLAAALDAYPSGEAHSVARVLMEGLFGCDRLSLAFDPQAEVADTDRIDEITREVKAARPAQYITGVAEFRGLTFEVGQGVLIPRPETEELVAWVAGEAGNAAAPHGMAILDIGTGSGAIAVALAREVEGSAVSAIDLSAEALEMTARNAKRNDAQVRFYRADVLKPLSEWEGEWRPESFDAVVSNPPYIPRRDMDAMHRNVTQYEPHMALFVPDDDPLLFYKAVADRALELLRRGGRLYFEIYEHAADEMVAMLSGRGYSQVEVRRDINDKQRMVGCVKS